MRSSGLPRLPLASTSSRRRRPRTIVIQLITPVGASSFPILRVCTWRVVSGRGCGGGTRRTAARGGRGEGRMYMQTRVYKAGRRRRGALGRGGVRSERRVVMMVRGAGCRLGGASSSWYVSGVFVVGRPRRPGMVTTARLWCLGAHGQLVRSGERLYWARAACASTEAARHCRLCALPRVRKSSRECRVWVELEAWSAPSVTQHIWSRPQPT